MPHKKRFPSRYCPLTWFKCTGINREGKGIICFHDKPFYIDELMPGESARIVVYYEELKYGNGRAIMLKNPSQDRVLELGHWKFNFGGYHIPHWSNKMQDAWKTQQVKTLYPTFSVPNIIVKKRNYYRNKVVLHDGGLLPPGPYRGVSIKDDRFDLMNIDFQKYQNIPGTYIIRRLDTEISGTPGSNIYTTTTLLGKKMIVNLNSFYQVNQEMIEIVIKKIKTWMLANERGADLFCGIGTLGIQIADSITELYMVEINPNSFRDCMLNIQNNHLTNIKAFCTDANAWIIKNKTKLDFIILNPARAGVSEASLKIINNSRIKKIIYLACNIYKQHQDLMFLNNYKIKEIQPYDFFPQTFHIENLIYLELKNN